MQKLTGDPEFTDNTFKENTMYRFTIQYPIPASWHLDPYNPVPDNQQERWWNGLSWTNRVRKILST